MDAHHEFPKALRDFFDKIKGLDIWDPKNGALWDSASHRANWMTYQRDWEAWFQQGGTSMRAAMAKGRELAKRYGFDWP